MQNSNGDKNDNGDSSNGGSSSWIPKPPPSPPPPQNEHERIEQARDLAIGLFTECAEIVKYAGSVEEHYLKLIHTSEINDELDDFDRGFLVLQISLSFGENIGALQHYLPFAEKLIAPFADLYDRFSAGPLSIGPITSSNAHMTALMLGRHFLSFAQRRGPGLMPLEGQGRREPNDLSLKQVVELLPKWRASARSVYHDALSIVGFDYEKECDKWIALTRIEAGKAAAAAPVEPVATSTDEHEGWVLDALRKADRPLTQWLLLDAAGLKRTGTNNGMLASMRRRGLIDNLPRKGFILPEWRGRKW